MKSSRGFASPSVTGPSVSTHSLTERGFTTQHLAEPVITRLDPARLGVAAHRKEIKKPPERIIGGLNTTPNVTSVRPSKSSSCPQRQTVQ